MSAYICDDHVFATLGAFAAMTLDTDAQAAADLLALENVRSVNYRYNESTEAAPVDMAAAEQQPDRGRLLELCSELEYQSCECPDYGDTSAALLLQRIRSAAVSFVPGDDTEPGELIGRAVYRPFDGKHGYIVGVRERGGKLFSMGVSALNPLSNTMLDIIWLPREQGHELQRSENSMTIAQPWIESEHNWPPITTAQAEALAAAEQQEQDARAEAYKARQARKEAERAAFVERVQQIIPADCRGAIIAELHENMSDTQTDYFHSRAGRVLLLGWSKHNRNNFAEMRKALRAADIEDLPELQALADPEQSEERREDYTGGSGYYLQAAGESTYSGWKVKKVKAWRNEALSASDIPTAEIKLPKGKPGPDQKPRKRHEAARDEQQPAVTVRLNEEKQGVELEFSAKPGDEVRAQLKVHGFRWSRRQGIWYAKQSPERLELARKLAGYGIKGAAA